VAFVGLAPLGDAALVMPTVSRVLGLTEAGVAHPLEALRQYLRDKTFLLVLDNFEHVAGAAPEVADLLGSCPNLTVLVTSRAPLRVRGEREYSVAPLAVPDPTLMPEAGEVAGTPAARLFVERATEASPAFVLTQRNAAAVAAICWRLDGLPLALELAAAQARFLGPTALLSRLDRALQAGGARDLPERQRTMRPPSTGATVCSRRKRGPCSGASRYSRAASRSRLQRRCAQQRTTPAPRMWSCSSGTWWSSRWSWRRPARRG
jgi:predicted ATPase